MTPREQSPAPAPAALPTPAGRPAGTTNTPPVEPEPFSAPPVVGDDRSQTSVAIPSRPEPRAQVAPLERPAEAFLVAGALRSLRYDHAPRDALAKLDEHRRRFPGGALHREAALARVEALLGLGRNDEARTVLDSLTLGSTGADRHARLARAELRADRGNCAGAVDDLNGILAGAANDKVAARALYRRARCALRVRNLGGARVDLSDYLARFPKGHAKRRSRSCSGASVARWLAGQFVACAPETFGGSQNIDTDRAHMRQLERHRHLVFVLVLIAPATGCEIRISAGGVAGRRVAHGHGTFAR